jgi:hypothetical protein
VPPRHVLDGLVRQQIRQIADALDRHKVLPQVCPAPLDVTGARHIGRFVREIVGCAAEDAEELVETVTVRPEFRFPPEMPLADECRVIVVRLQQRRDRRLIRRQADIRR